MPPLHYTDQLLTRVMWPDQRMSVGVAYGVRDDYSGTSHHDAVMHLVIIKTPV